MYIHTRTLAHTHTHTHTHAMDSEKYGTGWGNIWLGKLKCTHKHIHTHTHTQVMEKEGQVGKFLVGENQVFNKIMLPTYLEFTKVGMTIA